MAKIKSRLKMIRDDLFESERGGDKCIVAAAERAIIRLQEIIDEIDYLVKEFLE